MPSMGHALGKPKMLQMLTWRINERPDTIRAYGWSAQNSCYCTYGHELKMSWFLTNKKLALSVKLQHSAWIRRYLGKWFEH